jgi:hypothetical protein
MATFRAISKSSGLYSLLTSAVTALRGRAIAPHSGIDAHIQRGSSDLRENEVKSEDESPTWPPADGIYWGM